MRVYVTHAQFAEIQKAKLRLDITSDPKDVTALSGMLSACCLSNGGDYNPALARAGVETELVVISEQGMRPATED